LIQREDGSIVFGGARAPDAEWQQVDDGVLNAEISASLRRYVDKYFGDDVEVVGEWTGIMAFTDDEQPIVGALPQRPRHVASAEPSDANDALACHASSEFIAVGFNGNGMSQCFVCARELVNGIVGKPHKVPPSLSPTRFLATQQQ
jgi:glycine/D-amino acid oxidase-like deaminating enzyme